MSAMGASQAFDLGDAPELAPGATDVVAVLDPSGEIERITVGGDELPLGLLGGSLTGLMGQGFQRDFVGPVLPEGRVVPGETWASDETTSVLGVEFAVSSRHTYVGDEDLGGRTAARIESETTFLPIEFDLVAMLREMIATDAFGDLDGAAPAEIGGALEMLGEFDMGLVIATECTVGTTTSWFDPDAGVVVKAIQHRPMVVDLEMSDMPDTGDLTMHIEITTDFTVEVRS